jgi:hypothetical protein
MKGASDFAGSSWSFYITAKPGAANAGRRGEAFEKV